ncbi:hypothetical protein SYNTR_0286 [Candidatus Syntrophocurvum alkaliphilum]|uniref:Phosphoesterase n=1 Tax=Candidatus Syntrophocurvum alkaliphilum TaxID=2293317 RepID=A0A6I6DGX4_9FIRM|nr:metallophosphoesterase [Candidatus Syntrophocurvum alkaliphilum]QGT98879.1 hypothetical protein SYNTR_0286 [Candidatus Syntrophocurvum alkaliphilum]
MKIFVVGDTHGSITKVQKKIENIKPDYIFFTGDHYSDGLELAQNNNIEFKGVVGNCDRYSSGPEDSIIDLEGVRFYLTHGHNYGVKSNLNRLYYKAEELNANIVIFGHTHISYCEKINNIWMLNPGSASRPRKSPRGTFALIEINNQSIDIKILDLVESNKTK